MQIKPGSLSHLVLLALRAGEMEPYELDERFSSNYKPLRGLLRAGFISQAGSAYSITPAGREACPLRREIKPEITENAYYFDKKKPSASSIHSSVSSRRSSVPSWPREKQPDGPINDVDPVDLNSPSRVSVISPGTQLTSMAEKAIVNVEKVMKPQAAEDEIPNKKSTFRPPLPPKAKPPANGIITLKHILEVVIGFPGIRRSELMHGLDLDEKNNKKAIQIISDAVYRKRLKQDDETRLYPGETINASLKRIIKLPKVLKEKVPTGKLVPFSEAAESMSVFARNCSAALLAENPAQANPQAANKPKSLIAIEYLHSVGSATGTEIKRAVIASGKTVGTEGASCYIAEYIKRGLVAVSDGSTAGKTYTIKPGMSLNEITADGRKSKPRKNKSATAAPEFAQNCAEKSTEEFKPDEPVGKILKLPEHNAHVPEKTASPPSCPERQYSAHQVYIDATGQLIIQHPGVVRMVFPAEDTRRIRKLFLAIDLESLCA